MRRALLIVALGGVLVTGAACGTATSPPPGSQAGGQSAPVVPGATGPTFSADTKKICTAVGEVLGENLGAFGSEMGKMIANKEAKVSAGAKEAEEQAKKKLTAFASAMRKATEESENPQLRDAGDQTADRLQASAEDDKFFDGIKTAKDLEKALGPTMTQWLQPVQSHCA